MTSSTVPLIVFIVAADARVCPAGTYPRHIRRSMVDLPPRMTRRRNMMTNLSSHETAVVGQFSDNFFHRSLFRGVRLRQLVVDCVMSFVLVYRGNDVTSAIKQLIKMNNGITIEIDCTYCYYCYYYRSRRRVFIDRIIGLSNVVTKFQLFLQLNVSQKSIHVRSSFKISSQLGNCPSKYAPQWGLLWLGFEPIYSYSVSYVYTTNLWKLVWRLSVDVQVTERWRLIKSWSNFRRLSSLMHRLSLLRILFPPSWLHKRNTLWIDLHRWAIANQWLAINTQQICRAELDMNIEVQTELLNSTLLLRSLIAASRKCDVSSITIL